jgi:hypothetical protein
VSKERKERIVDDEVIPDYPALHCNNDDDEPEPEPENELDDADMVALNTEDPPGEGDASGEYEYRKGYPDYSELGPAAPRREDEDPEPPVKPRL